MNRHGFLAALMLPALLLASAATPAQAREEEPDWCHRYAGLATGQGWWASAKSVVRRSTCGFGGASPWRVRDGCGL